MGGEHGGRTMNAPMRVGRVMAKASVAATLSGPSIRWLCGYLVLTVRELREQHLQGGDHGLEIRRDLDDDARLGSASPTWDGCEHPNSGVEWRLLVQVTYSQHIVSSRQWRTGRGTVGITRAQCESHTRQIDCLASRRRTLAPGAHIGPTLIAELCKVVASS